MNIRVYIGKRCNAVILKILAKLKERINVVNELGASLMEGMEPVSPLTQYYSSTALSLTVLAIFESEIPIDDSVAFSTLRDVFLPLNKRFSSVMVKDNQRIPRYWKRVSVKLEDHINIPLFPEGLESYDACLQDYLSKIALDPLPQDKPLWNIHLVKYPTKSASGVLVMKLHHSLGDGFSLMGALFSSLRRVDNPSLPPSFPSQHVQRGHDRQLWLYKSAMRAFSVCSDTVRDFYWSLVNSSFLEDGKSPIRSGDVGVEFRPVTMSMLSFSLNDIKQIKDKLKGTINDVVTGIIFYGVHLYMHDAGLNIKPTKVTGLVLLNTRAVKTYKTIEEMSRSKTKAPWGNHFTFLHVSIPECGGIDKDVEPLAFIRKAKLIIKMKMNSLALNLAEGLLEMTRKLKGPEASARYIYSTLSNTSFALSNLIGPMEQVEIAGHPVKGLYFSVVGAPQSLTVTMASYMGKMQVILGAEKDFIDSELLIACMEKSCRRMYEAAVGDINKRDEKFKIV